ncbi:MAG: hypothetical protein WDN47_02635 [Candidatus Doudnabacteria bacterium]
MIDSVRIRISNFHSVENNPYFQDAKGSFDNDKNGKKRIKKLIHTSDQFRKSQQAKGIYIMKYWTHQSSFNRGNNYLYLEVSLPKLKYGQNYYEISEADLEVLIDSIISFLASIKVSASRNSVRDGVVTMVSYCKNLNVKAFGTTEEALAILAHSKYRFRSSFEPKFNPNGQLTHLEYFNRTSSHFVVYDQIQSLLDQGFTKEEKEIHRKLADNKESILRFELTLHNVTSVRQFLSKFYPSKKNFTLAEVFKYNIANDLLKHEVDQIFNHPLNGLVVSKDYDYRQLNQQVKDFIEKNYSDGKLKAQLYQAVGVLRLEGWAGLKNHLKQTTGSRSTYFRRLKEIKDIEVRGIELNVPDGAVLNFVLQEFGINPKSSQKQQSLF